MDDNFEDVELSPRMVQVIQAFLEDPAREHYGFELMRATGLPSGTLYPLLFALRGRGWLTSELENIDPRAEGRPARRSYKISASAVPAARRQLAQMRARFWVPGSVAPRPVTVRPEVGAP